MLKNKLRKEMDMCARPLLGKMILFTLPLIATGILQLLYNAADIIVVGRFAGETAMAAVGSTGSLVNLLTNLFIGLSVGALSSTARWIGAKNKEKVDSIVHTSILLSIISGIILAVVGVFISKYLLILMKTPDDVLPLSTLYLQIFFIGMPFNLLYNFGASVLRATGDTKNPLIFLTFAGLVNVAFNLIFVIVFDMGVAGVAIATIISQAISSILVVLCLMRKKGYGKLYLKRLRIDAKALKEIALIGLPAGIQSTIFSFSNVIIQSSINSLGQTVMAGNVAASNIEGFVYVAMNSVSQACLTFTGQNYGAGKSKNINLVLTQSLLLVSILGVVMGVSCFLLGKPLLSIYNTNPEVIKYGLERMSVVCSTYFLCGVMEVLVGSLRGIGHSILPMIVSILGVCGVRLLWIYTLFASTQSLMQLYLSYPISWICTLAIHFVCFFIVRKKAFSKMTPSHTLTENMQQ